MQSTQNWVTRSDAWTPADDERLAEIVLTHIRTGSTQLKAFEEAGNELGRTSAACGYRWNGVLRKDRRSEIEAAKQERKAAQKAGSTTITQEDEHDHTAVTVNSADSMKEVIQFLHTYDEQYQALRSRVQTLEAEKENLIQRLQELDQHTVPQSVPDVTPRQLEEDSRTLFAIMERARKLLDPSSNPKVQTE